MPALNFTVFIDKIESGEKQQTIRLVRKRPIKLGDKLYIYTGMRTKNCRKLGEAICKKVISINLILGDLFGDGTVPYFYISKRGSNHPWPIEWQVKLAVDDGFRSFEDFETFFIKTYKMKSGDRLEFDIIKWKDFTIC